MTISEYNLNKYKKNLKKLKKDPNREIDFIMQLKKLNKRIEAEKGTDNGKDM